MGQTVDGVIEAGGSRRGQRLEAQPDSAPRRERPIDAFIPCRGQGSGLGIGLNKSPLGAKIAARRTQAIDMADLDGTRPLTTPQEPTELVLDFDSDEPLPLCPLRREGAADDEACEACQ